MKKANFQNKSGTRSLKPMRTILAFLALAIGSAATAQAIRTTVNGDKVYFPDVQPTMVNNRVMVPVRGVFEHMNAVVEWDSDARTVIAKRAGDTIRLPVNSNYATINGREVMLDAPATNVMGRTMVPLRFISESLGANVDWVPNTRTVEITHPNELPLPAFAGNVDLRDTEGISHSNELTQRGNSGNMTQRMYDQQSALYNSMRTLWVSHVTWTRMFIVSVANNLSNRDATTARLMQNQVDIGNAIKPVYGIEAGDRLTSLLRTHINISSEIVIAAKSNNTRKVADQKAKWYVNSNQIADFLSTSNPRNWTKNEMREMMREHLDLTLEEANAELNGDYRTSVRKFDEIQVHILDMADMLSEGIVAQFPNRFGTGTVVGGRPIVVTTASEMRIDSGTVLPFRLNQTLSSNTSEVGDTFRAVLDSAVSSNYQGMPPGSILEGHVDYVRAKSGDTPGLLGLAFDRVRLPDGQVYSVQGTLIGLDSESVTNENGRLVAKSGAKKDNLKYVGYGAGGGALIALLTKGNLLTNSIIGAALGFLYGEIQKDPSKVRDVTLDSSTKFGVRLTRDFTFQVPNARNP